MPGVLCGHLLLPQLPVIRAYQKRRAAKLRKKLIQAAPTGEYGGLKLRDPLRWRETGGRR
jgi:hypothetical protein